MIKENVYNYITFCFEVQVKIGHLGVWKTVADTFYDFMTYIHHIHIHIHQKKMKISYSTKKKKNMLL